MAELALEPLGAVISQLDNHVSFGTFRDSIFLLNINQAFFSRDVQFLLLDSLVPVFVSIGLDHAIFP